MNKSFKNSVVVIITQKKYIKALLVSITMK